METAKYKRVVLKLSGESLAGEQGFGINPTVVEAIAKQIKRVHETGIDVAIVWLVYIADKQRYMFLSLFRYLQSHPLPEFEKDHFQLVGSHAANEYQ